MKNGPREREEASDVPLWVEARELPRLVCHPCPVINDLWLEGGCKQRAYQPALLWDNLHPTAIFFTKHQLTRPILHYKLGLPDPLGSACGNSQKSWSDARWKTGQWIRENNAMSCGINYRVVVFNIQSKTFSESQVTQGCMPDELQQSIWISILLHPSLLFSDCLLSLSLATDGRKVNWPQQSVSIKLHCNSRFCVCHWVHLQREEYNFRGQYNTE